MTSYEILVDSPLIAGAHYRADSAQHRRHPRRDRRHRRPNSPATPEQIAAHKRLVEQAVKTFGAQHYDHYDFLLTISNNLGGNGLEHHRSSEDGVRRGYFTDWENKLRDRNLLPHEYSHSWDGKYRRPADLWTPDYNTRADGRHPAVGLRRADAVLGLCARRALGHAVEAGHARRDRRDRRDLQHGTPGRAWRPLVDTTNDPTVAGRAPQPWRSWQRSEDYYSEGQLIWIDVDRIIRQQSGGKRSIDDFAKAFFGVRDRDYGELTYTLDDIVATLNGVQPYDWRGYLQRRVYDRRRAAAARGHQRGRLQARLHRRADQMDQERARRPARTATSPIRAGSSSAMTARSRACCGTAPRSMPASPSVRRSSRSTAAISIADALKDAIKAAAGNGPAPQLLVHDGDVYRTVKLDWHGGLRYPRLEKVGKGQGTLDALLAPR